MSWDWWPSCRASRIQSGKLSRHALRMDTKSSGPTVLVVIGRQCSQTGIGLSIPEVYVDMDKTMLFLVRMFVATCQFL